MSLLTALLVLAAGLHLCIGNEKEDAFYATLSTDLQEVQNEIINKHNELRRVPHASNMLKMEWNETAKINSQNWCKKCNYSHSPSTRRIIENGMQCGENLLYSSVPLSWSDVIQAWYDEYNDFIFGEGPKYPGAKVGHYTAIVSSQSHRCGCAVTKCPFGYYYICQYCPTGNIIGPDLYKPYKIGEPCGNCPNHCDAGLCTNPCERKDVYANCKNLKRDFSCKHAVSQKHHKELRNIQQVNSTSRKACDITLALEPKEHSVEQEKVLSGMLLDILLYPIPESVKHAMTSGTLQNTSVRFKINNAHMEDLLID
ncbi:cysteine-rich secretory protein 3-like [Tiliqua scincoides]|uniref:cysteine-rich secretory protein 3-like n=1 Tax=Tiliqua scincoides TaxID=71010 RepID=UPI0034633BCB